MDYYNAYIKYKRKYLRLKGGQTDDFPYIKNYLSPFDQMFDRLKQLANNLPVQWDTNDDYIGIVKRTYPDDYILTDGLVDHFVEHLRIKCHHNNKPTPFELWNKIKFNTDLPKSTKERRQLVRRLSKECELFNVALGVYMIKKLGAESMLDLTTGWGSKLVCAIACDLKYYRGLSSNTELQPIYKKLVEMTGSSIDWKIRNTQFESSLSSLKDKYNNKFDLVTLSSQFFDFNLKRWYDNFFIPVIELSATSVNTNGHIAYHIPFGKMFYVANNILENYNITYIGKIGLKQIVIDNESKITQMYIWKPVDNKGIRLVPITDKYKDSIKEITSQKDTMKMVGTGETWNEYRIEKLLQYILDDSKNVIDRRTYIYWGILYNGKFIGIISFHPVKYEKTTQTDKLFTTIFIHRDYIGKGIAYNVYKLALDILKNMDINHIIADIDVKNIGSIKLFKKLGFKITKNNFNIGKNKFNRYELN